MLRLSLALHTVQNVGFIHAHAAPVHAVAAIPQPCVCKAQQMPHAGSCNLSLYASPKEPAA